MESNFYSRNQSEGYCVQRLEIGDLITQYVSRFTFYASLPPISLTLVATASAKSVVEAFPPMW
jgi:hypothetical protein